MCRDSGATRQTFPRVGKSASFLAGAMPQAGLQPTGDTPHSVDTPSLGNANPIGGAGQYGRWGTGGRGRYRGEPTDRRSLFVGLHTGREFPKYAINDMLGIFKARSGLGIMVLRNQLQRAVNSLPSHVEAARNQVHFAGRRFIHKHIVTISF